MRSLASWLARRLRAEEREAVLGDLAEAGVSGWKAAFDVAGLVARRQAELWKNWRRWAALGGVVLGAWPVILAAWRAPAQLNLGWWILSNYKYFDPELLAEHHLTLARAIWEVFGGWVLIPVYAAGMAWALRRFVRGSLI